MHSYLPSSSTRARPQREQVLQPVLATCCRAWLFLLTLAVAAGMGSVPPPAFAAACHISSIIPACAAVGDTVTLTGNGFGAPNVRVTVGGVTAPVVSASGKKVTFRVPAGVPSGLTAAIATNPGGQTDSIALRVKGPEICGDAVDNDCDGQIDEPEACQPVNKPPVAAAGPDQTGVVGTTVHLNGSASSDVDGDLLTYHWAFSSRPPGSTATLANPTTVTPTFVVDKPGEARWLTEREKQLVLADLEADHRRAGPRQHGFGEALKGDRLMVFIAVEGAPLRRAQRQAFWVMPYPQVPRNCTISTQSPV